jgi:hypothetical protein
MPTDLSTALAVASFPLAVGGIVAALLVRSDRKWIVYTMTLAALLVASIIYFWDRADHERRVDRLEASVLAVLSSGSRTIDGLYEELGGHPDFSTVQEALNRSVERGAVVHRTESLVSNSGDTLRVRVYRTR